LSDAVNAGVTQRTQRAAQRSRKDGVSPGIERCSQQQRCDMLVESPKGKFQKLRSCDTQAHDVGGN